jgi:antitoxin ParD1/3/4
MARQTTLNVSLTSTLRRYVHTQVKSGRYESASEVVRDSLRALQQREQATTSFWADVRQQVAVARDDVVAGRVVDGDSAMDEIIAELGAGPKSPTRRKRRAG